MHKTFKAILSNGERDLEHLVRAASLEAADAFLETDRELWKQLGAGWFVVSLKPARGGKREGAGRKCQNGEKPTVVRRVKAEYADRLEDLYALAALIEDWRSRSEDADPTSPRWEKLRQLLNEARELGF